jgi:hypothetical protein
MIRKTCIAAFIAICAIVLAVDFASASAAAV